MAKVHGHIVITGASSGIGEALALRYAAPGVLLSLTGRDAGRLEDAARACRERGAQVHAAIVDVADREAMRAFLIDADARKPIDLLIANAGISGGTGGSKEGEGVAQARAIFAVNVEGVFNTVEPMLPRMLQRGEGQIALMASLAAWRGWPGAPAYCASKAAVRSYGEGLRGALMRTGVKVNVICPGFVVSRMTGANDFSMPFLMDTAKAAKIIARGLEKNKGRICFPMISYLIVRFIAALPDRLATKLLSRLPAKPPAA